MSRFQELWWEQAHSDHGVLVLLRQNGAGPCHQLHYLQMVTEKLAKAYFWYSGTPPAKSHAGFVLFMRALGGVQRSKQAQLSIALSFRNFNGLQSWIRSVRPLARELELLAPALAQNGPNPEYPWPQNAPIVNPIRHQFPVWNQLTNTPDGRQLVRFIQLAIDNFPTYA